MKYMLEVQEHLLELGQTNHMNPDIIGSIAATLTTLSFIPQVIKLLKTRHTKDISLSMYVIFTVGVALWLAYGLMLQRPPIIISNIVTLGLTSIILYLKLKEKD
jgi:MtN3 and saliva related transmembrane protein